MEVKAVARFVRLSSSKARPLARKLQGRPVGEALQIVEWAATKAGTLIGQTLRSAVANARKNAKASVDNLWVARVAVDEGPRMKRGWPRARGGVRPIVRRMSHITVVVTDKGGKKARPADSRTKADRPA